MNKLHAYRSYKNVKIKYEAKLMSIWDSGLSFSDSKVQMEKQYNYDFRDKTLKSKADTAFTMFDKSNRTKLQYGKGAFFQ